MIPMSGGHGVRQFQNTGYETMYIPIFCRYIEAYHSEQCTPPACFRKPSDIKFPVYRVCQEILRFLISLTKAYPICRKFQAESFWKGVRGDSMQCREMSAGQRVAGAVGANLFSKRFFPHRSAICPYMPTCRCLRSLRALGRRGR